MSERPDRQRSASVAPTGAGPLLAVPRSWLIAVIVLVTLPWVVVAAVWWGGDRPSQPAPLAVAGADRAATTTAGPWGELVIQPITISPPAEYVPRTWGEVQPSVWHFPPMTGDELETRLVGLGLSREEARALRSTARASAVGGLFVTPAAELVAGLAPAVRARVYLELGRIAARTGPDSPINYDQATSYRYFGSSLDDWLNPAMIAPETRRLVEPYVYAHDGFLYFADIEYIRARIQDPDELQRLAKVLLRQATMLVEVQVPGIEAVDAMADYWGRGGRRTDLKPLLESIALRNAADHRSIDVSHLLPPLARQHLYRYPRPSVEDFERPLLANCLWTALNFFAPEPDARYLDPAFALERLKADYFLVQDNLQLGDIVAFTDTDGVLVHVAVYLAGDLLFSKNGTSPLSPWSILPLDRFKGHYVEHADGWKITYHRRKDL